MRRQASYFSDGVEVNGVPLELSGILFHLMQCFRFKDRVTEEAVAEGGWGNKLKKRTAILSAFRRLKAITTLEPFNISFSYNTGFWEILYQFAISCVLLTQF